MVRVLRPTSRISPFTPCRISTFAASQASRRAVAAETWMPPSSSRTVWLHVAGSEAAAGAGPGHGPGDRRCCLPPPAGVPAIWTPPCSSSPPSWRCECSPRRLWRADGRCPAGSLLPATTCHSPGWGACHPQGRSEAQEPRSGLTRRPPRWFSRRWSQAAAGGREREHGASKRLRSYIRPLRWRPTSPGHHDSRTPRANTGNGVACASGKTA